MATVIIVRIVSVLCICNWKWSLVNCSFLIDYLANQFKPAWQAVSKRHFTDVIVFAEKSLLRVRTNFLIKLYHRSNSFFLMFFILQVVCAEWSNHDHIFHILSSSSISVHVHGIWSPIQHWLSGGDKEDSSVLQCGFSYGSATTDSLVKIDDHWSTENIQRQECI